MVRIKLFCAAGFSTSMLVDKMVEAAKRAGIEATIEAHSHAKIRDYVNDMDVALLGPQVGYALAKAKEICDPANIPVDVIPMTDYGTMNGENVLNFALKLRDSKVSAS